MRTDRASCLQGPVTAGRLWWNGEGQAPGGELFRAALVAQVRGEIAAGTYDTPERWEVALDRMAERLLSQ